MSSEPLLPHTNRSAHAPVLDGNIQPGVQEPGVTEISISDKPPFPTSSTACRDSQDLLRREKLWGILPPFTPDNQQSSRLITCPLQIELAQLGQ